MGMFSRLTLLLYFGYLCVSTHVSSEEPKIPKDCSVCGIKVESDVQTVIVGGSSVSDTRNYPWMVALMNGNTKDCGGAIISNKFIITAAHCVETPYLRNRPLAISPQEKKIAFLTPSTYKVTTGYPIKRIILHPGYRQEPQFLHDIALIELKTNITCDEYKVPICLPPRNFKLPANTTMKITGWGVINGSTKEVPKQLMEANVRLDNFSKCVPRFVTPDMERYLYCLTGVDRETPCYGDSGGPLVLSKGEKFFLMGTTAGGATGCKVNDPFVYTSVSSEMEWISKVTGVKPVNP